MENLEIMKELKSIYEGKRIFVTGHTGFKGSWLIKILYDYGAIIKGYALAPEADLNLYSEMNGDVMCHSEINDLRDATALTNALLDFQPDFIFHLAAQSLVRKSYETPLETFEVNVIGTANLLDAIRLLEKKCNVVLITTDKVYQNNELHQPYKESDRLGGYDPYSASKACCELLIDSYKNSFFNFADLHKHKKAIAVCRAGNVIGGGDWSRDRLLPDIAKALNEENEIVIRNPKAIRPWQHIVEPLFGYLMLGKKLNENPIKYSQAFNFGPNVDDSLTVEEIVNLCISCWGEGAHIRIDNGYNPHEAGVLKLDINKAIKELGWKPILDAKVAVERTINWYKNFYNNIPANKLMELDIEHYIKNS